MRFDLEWFNNLIIRLWERVTQRNKMPDTGPDLNPVRWLKWYYSPKIQDQMISINRRKTTMDLVEEIVAIYARTLERKDRKKIDKFRSEVEEVINKLDKI